MIQLYSITQLKRKHVCFLLHLFQVSSARAQSRLVEQVGQCIGAAFFLPSNYCSSPGREIIRAGCSNWSHQSNLPDLGRLGVGTSNKLHLLFRKIDCSMFAKAD